jgi:hypothetical protein
MNRKVIISESEKRDILDLHNQTNRLFEGDIVVTDWISEDNRYAVFMDHLFDIENKTDLGNIWKKSDNLFLFLEHAFNVSSLPSHIKEESQTFFSKRVLLENTIDLTSIKPIIKKILKEDFWKDTAVGRGLGYAGKWVKDTAVDTYKGIGDTFKEAWSGLKQAGIAISKGDFKELMNLIGKGFLWAGRKIRQAAYSTVGMIIDAILVATGIGKVAQVVVWAIVVAVDIYEFISGDYEEKDQPMWMRVLFFGCDILGLVFAGVAAKGARAAIKGVVGTGAKSAAEMGPKIAANPTVMGIIKKMVTAIKDVPAKMAGLAKQLGKGGFWSGLLGKALSGVGKFVKGFLDSIASLFTKKEMRPILVQLGLIGGIGTYEVSQEEKLAELKRKKKAQDQNLASQGSQINKQGKELASQSSTLVASMDKTNPNFEDLEALKKLG